MFDGITEHEVAERAMLNAIVIFTKLLFFYLFLFILI